MLTLILYFFIGAVLILALIAWLRSRRTSYHDISASEIHPDLAAGEELLQDAMAENQRGEKPPSGQEPHQ
jgi:hypothetical protein